MGVYSSRTSDGLRDPYHNIDESYHQEAERYIDGRYLEPEGLSASTHWDTGSGDYKIPKALQDIAVWYVKERYAADSMVSETDVWFARKEENHRRRKELESMFNPNVQLWQTTQLNADTGDGSPMTARFSRG